MRIETSVAHLIWCVVHTLVFTVCASSLKLDEIVRGLMDDYCVLDSLIILLIPVQ